MLVVNADAILASVKTAPYQRALHVVGGKIMKLSPEKEMGRTTSSGASKKINISSVSTFSGSEIGRSSIAPSRRRIEGAGVEQQRRAEDEQNEDGERGGHRPVQRHDRGVVDFRCQQKDAPPAEQLGRDERRHGQDEAQERAQRDARQSQRQPDPREPAGRGRAGARSRLLAPRVETPEPRHKRQN